jgi:hypothetical protein
VFEIAQAAQAASAEVIQWFQDYAPALLVGAAEPTMVVLAMDHAPIADDSRLVKTFYTALQFKLQATPTTTPGINAEAAARRALDLLRAEVDKFDSIIAFFDFIGYSVEWHRIYHSRALVNTISAVIALLADHQDIDVAIETNEGDRSAQFSVDQYMQLMFDRRTRAAAMVVSARRISADLDEFLVQYLRPASDARTLFNAYHPMRASLVQQSDLDVDLQDVMAQISNEFLLFREILTAFHTSFGRADVPQDIEAVQNMHTAGMLVG